LYVSSREAFKASLHVHSQKHHVYIEMSSIAKYYWWVWWNW